MSRNGIQAAALAGLLIFIVVLTGYQAVEEWATVKVEVNRILSLLALGVPLIPVVIGSMAMASILADSVRQKQVQAQTSGKVSIRNLVWPYALWAIVGVMLSIGLHRYTPFAGQLDLTVVMVVAASFGVGTLTFIVKYLSRS